MYCLYCLELTVERLLDLAEKELTVYFFPSVHHYKHQPSIAALRSSGLSGCELCQFLFQGLTGVSHGYTLYEAGSREAAIKEAEAKGLPTDIKIAISASHLSGSSAGENRNRAELFDIMMVQAGLIEHLEDSGGETPIVYVPTLEVVMYSPEGVNHLTLHSYNIGRVITDSDLGSRRNFDLAQSWMKDCEQHANCRPPKPHQLPTRVIDVGTEDGYKDLKLLSTNGIMDEYITLSHCWGGTIEPLLKEANIGEWQNKMEFKELPANFQHAIGVTKQLGFRYLWIDAICIIQDSKEDWLIESTQMSEIYRNGALSISAATSQNSREGFLNNLPSLVKSQETTELRLSSTENDDRVVKLALRLPDEDDETLRSLFLSSKLHTRGWCLQETIISPRILHYGTRSIHYQCSQGFKSADGIPPPDRQPVDQHYHNFDILIHSPQSSGTPGFSNYAEGSREEYYTLVQEYSRRSLTEASDKFPAFSGIAKLMLPAFLPGEYAAGVWTNAITKGLAWYGDLGQCRHAPESSYCAPSWSWAISLDPVLFASLETPGAATVQAAGGQYNLELIETIRHGEDGYHDRYLEPGPVTLVVKAYTRRFLRSRQRTNMIWPEGASASVKFDEGEPGQKESDNDCSVFDLIQDGQNCLLSVLTGTSREKSDWMIDSAPRGRKEYLAIVLEVVQHTYPQGDTSSEGTGIVVEQVPGKEGSYRRVGYLTIGLGSTAKSADAFEQWMDKWERKTICLN